MDEDDKSNKKESKMKDKKGNTFFLSIIIRLSLSLYHLFINVHHDITLIIDDDNTFHVIRFQVSTQLMRN